MSKVILLGDTHIGQKGDHNLFHERFDLFFQFLFLYMLNAGIKRIIQFGDLFDRRKYVNFVSLGKSKEYLFDKLKEYDFTMDTFIGNHDIPFKNTLKYNSPSLLLGEYADYVNIIQEPTSLKIGNTSATIIPWMCDENLQTSLDFIENSNDPLCFGHFEMAGFEYSPGIVSEHGISKDLFWKFNHVYSGHYHHISTKDNITYIGSPCQLTWADYADPRGFFVLDTDTLKVEFIENPYPNFHKILYDDSKMSLKEIEEQDLSEYKNTFVKVIVREKNDHLIFDTLIEKLENAGVYITVVEDHQHNDIKIDDIIISEADDTLETFKKLSEKYSGTTDQNKLFNLLTTLHDEALKIE